MATAPAGARAPSTAQPGTHGPDRAVPSLRAHAAAVAAPWCGTGTATDAPAYEVDNGLYRYHAIYLVPSDGANRLNDYAPAIQAGALGASSLLERLYGRAIRFDMGTDCGPQYLNISFVRTSLTTADFEQATQTADGSLKAVATALAQAGFQTLTRGAERSYAATLTRNWVVWLDAPGPSTSCGAAQIYDDSARSPANWNNYGGKVAVLFHNDGGFCGDGAVRHEIGHTLGALTPAAPHAFDGAHCNDAFEDTMCDVASPARAGDVFQNQFFDYGNDDYWDPPGGRPLGWWTVDLNRFLCAEASCNGVQVAPTAEVAAPPQRALRSRRAPAPHRWRARRARRGPRAYAEIRRYVRANTSF